MRLDVRNCPSDVIPHRKESARVTGFTTNDIHCPCTSTAPPVAIMMTSASRYLPSEPGCEARRDVTPVRLSSRSELSRPTCSRPFSLTQAYPPLSIERCTHSAPAPPFRSRGRPSANLSALGHTHPQPGRRRTSFGRRVKGRDGHGSGRPASGPGIYPCGYGYGYGYGSRFGRPDRNPYPAERTRGPVGEEKLRCTVAEGIHKPDDSGANVPCMTAIASDDRHFRVTSERGHREPPYMLGKSRKHGDSTRTGAAILE
ncbi:hypothetical protein BD309DRAFT_973327 [Dichomitus squalens]|uniref:Uncharacterized protein n=1 Tax=Dichomitus squalens TaxID=114155 RepID=A0A4Q9Q159_9APHY|nr:hypothetical protein BD309DRAFT_973327 [Dichomitus squalens]TBU60284.1 hypothetical protein BD310DRAFT_340104 [Dichomitus squalens]